MRERYLQYIFILKNLRQHAGNNIKSEGVTINVSSNQNQKIRTMLIIW